jgi:hypothetical protein
VLSRSRTFIVVLILSLIVAATVAVHLLPGLDSSRLENGIRNSLHFILFATVAALAYQVVPSGATGKFLIALIVVIATGILSELAQSLAGGAVDMADLFRDVSGAATMLLAMVVFSASRRARRKSAVRLALQVLASAFAVLIFFPLIFWTSALLFERSRHPVVLDFDSPYSRYRYAPINAEVTLVGDSSEGNNTLAEILLSKRGRSGLAIETAKYDWSGKSTLVVEGATANLTVHINDDTNLGKFIDTESGTVTLLDGWQEYRIPVLSAISEAGRGDDITNIRQLVILARDKQAGARLRLDDIRLE